MPMAPHPRTSRLAGHFFAASPLGSPTKPAERAAGAHMEFSSPKRPPCQAAPFGPLAAPPPRPRRAPPEARRRAVRVSERRPRRPAPAPRPAPANGTPFLQLAQRTRRPPETPPVGSKLCALQRRSDPHKVCAAEPLPYLRWGSARPRRSGAGPAGSSAQPWMRREFATVAAARAPRRPRGASASRWGEGSRSPGRGRARARDLAYLRWLRATTGGPPGLCAAAGRARSGGERATTNGDISRRSTWRAERASVPRRCGRQPSPHRCDVGERESELLPPGRPLTLSPAGAAHLPTFPSARLALWVLGA